jgi:hypothetical protein
VGCIHGAYIAIDNACVSIQDACSDGVRNNSMVWVDIIINIMLETA